METTLLLWQIAVTVMCHSVLRGGEWNSCSHCSVLQEWIFFSIALQVEDISPVIFLQYFSVILFFSPLHFFPRRLQYVAGWIVCYYPAGDNIITTYLLSRVCKEWCCLGPQWSNNLTQGSRITHSWLGEVKHYQLERGVNKREVPPHTHTLAPSLVKIEGDTPPLRQTEDAILPRLDRNICLVQVLNDMRLQGRCGRAVCTAVCHFRWRDKLQSLRCAFSAGRVAHNYCKFSLDATSEFYTPCAEVRGQHVKLCSVTNNRGVCVCVYTKKVKFRSCFPLNISHRDSGLSI